MIRTAQERRRKAAHAMPAGIARSGARSRPIRLATGVSLVLIVALLLTSGTTRSMLGVPHYWSWLLTSLQVLALWGAGKRCDWGWPLGAAVQPAWIVYAVLTGQFGFIPGCIVSALVQLRSSIAASVDGANPCKGRSPTDVSASRASPANSPG